jgi:hypothetical protein
MRYNLITETFDFELEDYTKCVMNQLKIDTLRPIIVKENTDHGFETTINLPKTVIYLIYKVKQLLYIGCSNTSIRNRIGRFVAGVRGTEHKDEQHIAAYRYVEIFGRDLSDVYIKTFSLKNKQLNCGIKLPDIESSLIQEMNPWLNNENYKNFTFKNVVIATRKLAA